MKHLILILLTSLLSLAACKAPQPDEIGLHNGSLSDCPSSPNCVSSLAESEEHYLPPIEFSSPPDSAAADLMRSLNQMKRMEIITREGNYLHVVYTVAFWGFQDDMEFLIDAEESVIHFRSASRVGHSDFGANKRRINKLKDIFYSFNP